MRLRSKIALHMQVKVAETFKQHGKIENMLEQAYKGSHIKTEIDEAKIIKACLPKANCEKC